MKEQVWSGPKYKVILCLIFCLISFSSPAQNTRYHPLDFLDNKNGLSQGTINCILQDKYGYLWFGTQDGLNKFDGIEFTVFKNDIEDPGSISDNYITCMTKGKNGNLWIGTRSGGLNKYNVKKGIFESFKHIENDSTSISHNWVSAIAKAPTGDLWVGTLGGGLNKFSVESEQFERYSSVGPSSGNTIHALLLDKNETLWIGAENGLNKFDPNTKKVTEYHYMSETLSSLTHHNILSLWEDNHHLWIGTNGGGLGQMDLEEGSLKTYQHDQNNRNSLSHNIIVSILGDGNGSIWVATDGGGLDYFDTSNETFIHYKVAFPRLKSLYKDSAKNLWVGQRGGVNKIGKYNSMFVQYRIDNKGNLLAPHGDIHALCEDEDGFIWMGSSVDGLKKINRTTLETTQYKSSASPGSLSSSSIDFLFVDSNETIWVGTFNGLNKYNRESDSFTAYLPDKSPHSISSGRINYIYEDSKNQLWICTDNGLNKFDRESETFTVIKKKPGNSNSLHNNDIISILEDADGIYWIGLASNGFVRYNPKSNTFKHYTHKDGVVNSLSNNRASHMYDDHQGNLWVATYGGGLNKFEKSTETFTHYNEKNGLANTSLYCVINDDNGNLWMSHNEGISKLDIDKGTFKNFMPGVEFNGRGHYKTRKGEIILGGFDIVTFYPDQVSENTLIPPVHINEFRLFNRPITPKNDGDLLTSSIEETDTIVLKYNENFFSFGFVSLNYTNATNNQFKYKLENFDTKWNEVGNFSNAHYTNVPPGEYIFKVIGSNNDHFWNEEGDQIYISVLPPWWGTLLFKVAVVSLVLLILTIFYKRRVRNIKQQKLALEEQVHERTEKVLEQQQEIITQKENISNQNNQLIALNEEKNELIQIVAHDLRSPLNQIKGLTSIIKIINPELNKETQDSIQLINDLIERQSTMIGKILDTNAIDANKINLQMQMLDVNPLIDSVLDTHTVVAKSKGITLRAELVRQKLLIEADKNFLIQILENLLSNAIKFSPKNTTINVATHLINNKVQIVICDEGPGISSKDKKFLFEPYTKLSAKPTANEASSGLGLSIAKKYMEVMNGEIWCESEAGSGASFFLQFDKKRITVKGYL